MGKFSEMPVSISRTYYSLWPPFRIWISYQEYINFEALNFISTAILLCNISISHIHIAYCLPITVSYVMVYCGISKWMISLWQTTSKLTERICTYRNWEHINHYQNWELLFLEMTYTFRIGVANAIKEWTYFQNKDLLQMLLFSFHTYPWNVCVCV